LANAALKVDGQWEPEWDAEKIPFERFLEKDPNWPQKFHVWKMEWTHDYIRLYLDEELLNEVNISDADYTDGFNPFRQPHYILLNLALGSNGGDPSDTDFPLKYEVDYVRVFQGKANE
jgi:beta-glucanase (GH16 family)